MTLLNPLLPALGALLAVILFLLGYVRMRGQATDQLDVEDLVLLRDERRREAAGQVSPLERLAGRLVPLVRRLIGRRGVLLLQKLIDRAGRPSGVTADTVLRRCLWWVLLLLPAWAALSLMEQPLTGLALLVTLPWMPVLQMRALAGSRRRAIEADLPDFLDILSVTVSAGIAFRPAMRRVSERFEGALADEVATTMDQMSHGVSLRGAFTQLRERCDSPSMDSFVRAFLQSEELGAPLADTLNQIALDMRRDSAQRWRRRAGSLVPQVTMVTSFVLVPGVMILVLLGVFYAADLEFADFNLDGLTSGDR